MVALAKFALGFALALLISSCLCTFSSCWVVNTNAVPGEILAYCPLGHIMKEGRLHILGLAC